MEVLAGSACYPERNDHIIRLVRESASTWKKVSHVVFVGCGSGYHEWTVLRMLQEDLSWPIEKVTLMEREIDPEWELIWNQMANDHKVSLEIVRSYWGLSKLPFVEHFAVIYINAEFFFSFFTCGENNVEREKESADAFWGICHEKAVNQPLCFQAYHERPIDLMGIVFNNLCARWRMNKGPYEPRRNTMVCVQE